MLAANAPHDKAGLNSTTTMPIRSHETTDFEDRNGPKSIREMPNPAESIKTLAAKESNPATRESLLRSAQNVDEIHRQVVEVFTRLENAIADSRSFAESIKKRDQLPTWVVFLVFGALFAFLAYVAVKHHL